MRGEGYGCSTSIFNFTYSALAIKFIQLQASPIMSHPSIQKTDHKEKGLLCTQLGHHACFTSEVIQVPLHTCMRAVCMHIFP